MDQIIITVARDGKRPREKRINVSPAPGMSDREYTQCINQLERVIDAIDEASLHAFMTASVDTDKGSRAGAIMGVTLRALAPNLYGSIAENVPAVVAEHIDLLGSFVQVGTASKTAKGE